MLNESNTFLNNVLKVILFPLLFQKAFILFAWGANDPTLLMITKRLFLLLPVLAFIGSCWLSIASLLTVLFRPNRQHFIISLFITWGELGKSIFSFWGGFFRFVFVLFFSLFGFLKIIIFGIWAIIKDIIFMPFRLLANLGRRTISSPVPWIAVMLTLFWCLIETVIFTYITTPLVIDVFSNITGQQLTENFVRIPLFIFLFFIVLGSYAVLSTFVTYVNSRKIGSIIGILIVEIIVIFVEVTFLYREFVDSIVPWLAQYSENFELGIFWTMAISTFVWFGIRSLSWFLFASYGTPTILQVIQGKGLNLSTAGVQTPTTSYVSGFVEFLNVLKNDADWIKSQTDELLNAFILPPLQVIAATINFCTLLITDKHLFEIPLKNTTDFTKSKELFQSVSKKEEPQYSEPISEPINVVHNTKIKSLKID